MDSLQKEIDKRLRQVPQSFKEAMNRTETFQEIHRLYDVCLLISKKQRKGSKFQLNICFFRVVNDRCDVFELRLKLCSNKNIPNT